MKKYLVFVMMCLLTSPLLGATHSFDSNQADSDGIHGEPWYNESHAFPSYPGPGATVDMDEQINNFSNQLYVGTTGTVFDYMLFPDTSLVPDTIEVEFVFGWDEDEMSEIDLTVIGQRKVNGFWTDGNSFEFEDHTTSPTSTYITGSPAAWGFSDLTMEEIEDAEFRVMFEVRNSAVGTGDYEFRIKDVKFRVID